MRIERRAFLSSMAGATTALAVLPGVALAAEPEIFQTDGIAINGTDPVGYFTHQRPVPGKRAHSVDWKGATWLFETAESAATFESDPQTYAPAFGGYCAFAASRGYLAPTIPEAWTIHNDKLYLNATLRVRRRWLRNVDEHIARGNANWPGILG